jgi:hypothetical protein
MGMKMFFSWLSWQCEAAGWEVSDDTWGWAFAGIELA